MVVEQQPPLGIDTERHVDPNGRALYPWWRRAALAVLVAVPVLGLCNVFGQRTESTRSTSPRASVLLESPTHVRGGLVFTTKIVITPRHDISDGQLYLDDGWFENMTLNGVSPQPSNAAAQDNWQTWDFGPMQAHQAFTVLISWQTNPTNVGSHPQTVALYDGNDRIMTIHRTFTVFP